MNRTELKIRTAVNQAEEAFWATIAEFFPEITTGDLDPLTSYSLLEKMKETVTIWHEVNSPTTTKGE